MNSMLTAILQVRILKNNFIIIMHALKDCSSFASLYFVGTISFYNNFAIY